MEFKQLQQLVETTDVFTEEMFETLTEFVNYNSNGMRVVVTEVLTTMKNRIDSGEEIQFYATGDVLTLDEFRETMQGIYTTSVSAATLDESPMAYKSIHDITDVINDSVDIIDVLKPVYNFKA